MKYFHHLTLDELESAIKNGMKVGVERANAEGLELEGDCKHKNGDNDAINELCRQLDDEDISKENKALIEKYKGF